MSYEDRMRQAFASKAAELAERAPTLDAASSDRAPSTSQSGLMARSKSAAWFRSGNTAQWTLAAVAAAAALIAAVFLIGNGGPERISTGPDFAAANATSMPVVVSTLVPTNPPTPRPSAEPAARATSSPVPTTAPVPTPSPPNSTAMTEVLLPGDDWIVEAFLPEVLPPYDGGLAPQYAAIDGDILGPVLQAYNLPHADYRRVGNPGGPYYDLVTPGGRTARVRTDDAPAVLLAVVAHEPGSFVVISYDLAEEDLVAAIDAVQIDGSRLSFAEPLPSGVQVIEADVAQLIRATYSLKRSEEERVQIDVMPPDQLHMALSQRAIHTDSEAIEGEGFRGFIYGSNKADDPGAVLLTGDAIYLVRLPLWSASSLPAAVDQVRDLVSTFAFRDTGPIFDGLGLQSRSEVYYQWMIDTPLPAGADLTWTLDGPPVDPMQEAFRAHQVFACAWAGYWIETGDTAALDEISAATDWPTGQLLGESRPDGSPLHPRPIEEARTLTDVDARERSALALDCSWLLGSLPPD